MEQAPRKRPGVILETLRTVLITVAIVLPIRFFVAQPFIVSGASMDPTLSSGEYLVIDEITYQLKSPQRQDVVVFKYPYDTSKYYIKRIVGLPDETIEIAGSQIFITDKSGNRFELDEPYLTSNTQNGYIKSATLGEDEYFVMGDNRGASSDSRIWGPLRSKFITGRAILRLLPIQKLDLCQGIYEFNHNFIFMST